MNILVTGGSGLVGKYVVDHLARVHKVSILDIKEPSSPHAFYWVDILNLPALTKALSHRFDAIVHMAAIPNPLNDPPEKIFTVNALGTFNVLEAASRCGVKRLVFVSSESVLGFAFAKRPAAPEYIPIDEEHPTRPHDPYGLSKLVGETICQSYSMRSSLQTVCLRPPWIWVPEEKEVEMYRDLVRNYAQGARNLWAYVHVEDLAAATLASIETEALEPYEVFFITAEDNWAGRDSRGLLQEFYPTVEKIAEGFGGQQSLVSSARAKAKLHYAPKHSWREIVHEQ